MRPHTRPKSRRPASTCQRAATAATHDYDQNGEPTFAPPTLGGIFGEAGYSAGRGPFGFAQTMPHNGG